MSNEKQVQIKTEMQVVDGVYTLATVQEQHQYANFLISSKLVSDTFKTASQLIIAIQLCKDLGLPNSALSNFYVIAGKPCVYGDVLVGLVMGSGLVKSKTVKYFDDSGNYIICPKKGQIYFGCEVTYERIGMVGPTSATYTMDDKDLSKTTNPTWVKYAKDMLWRRADVRAIKALFPDLLKGIEAVEHLDYDINLKEKKEIKSNQANEFFKNDVEV